MKSVFGILSTAILLLGCTASNQMVTPPSENIIDLSQNEEGEEYELVVLDPGFDNWYVTAWNQAKDRSVDYYSFWNYRYVTEWNYKATRPQTAQFFTSSIHYDPTVDYGIEVERKLYYYFRWVDTKLGIPILDTRPGAI